MTAVIFIYQFTWSPYVNLNIAIIDHYNHNCLTIEEVKCEQKRIIGEYAEKEKEESKRREMYFRDIEKRKNQRVDKTKREKQILKDLYNYVENESNNMTLDDDNNQVYIPQSNQEKYTEISNKISQKFKAMLAEVTLVLRKSEEEIQQKLIQALQNPIDIIKIVEKPIFNILEQDEQQELAKLLSGEYCLQICKQPTFKNRVNLAKFIIESDRIVKSVTKSFLQKVSDFDFDKSLNDFSFEQSFQSLAELQLKYHTDRVLQMQYSQKQNYLYSVSNDHHIITYDLNTRQIINKNKEEHAVKSLLLMNDDLVIVGLQNGEIRSYFKNKLQYVTNYHASAVYGLYKLNDFQFIASSDDDIQVVLWNATNFQKCLDYQKHSLAANSYFLLDNGEQIAKFVTVSDFDKQIRLFDAEKSVPIFKLEMQGEDNFRCAEKLTPLKFLVGTKMGAILLLSFNRTYTEMQQLAKFPKCHNDWITKILVFNDGNFATASCDKTIKFWHYNDNNIKMKQMLDMHTHSIFDLLVTSTGQLVSCSRDQTIILWK